MSVTRSVTGQPALLAGSASSGAFARWWFSHRIGGHDAGEVLEAVAALPDEPTGLTVLPYLSGRQTPAPDPRAVVRILDIDGNDVVTRPLDVAVMARAMLEGLSLHARWMLDTQTELVGAVSDPIRVLGGPGGGNQPWMTVKAQVFEQTTRLCSAAEPVAAGAALLAAHWAADLDGEAPVLDSTELARDPGDRYGDAYRRFVVAATAARQGGEK